MHLEDTQYQSHVKMISYRIESPIIFNLSKILNQNKSNNSNSDCKLFENNSSLLNKNIIEANNSNEKHYNHNKNYIKLILTLQPNTLEETKLLSITMIDYSEILNEEQLKDITQSIINNFNEIIINIVPLSKNCESIIVSANIHIVFDFLTTWKIADIGDGLMTELSTEGDPQKVGSKIKYNYFKYPVVSVVEEVNTFFQEGDEDDNNEWNYKYRMYFKKDECETVNCVFVSCENGSKTWVSVENDINEKIGIDKLQELSNRKLMVLNSMKNFIEKNKEELITLYNSKNNK